MVGYQVTPAIYCKILLNLTHWQEDPRVIVIISLLKFRGAFTLMSLDFTRVDESADATFQKV